MGTSLEAAVVISLILLILGFILARALPFTRAAMEESRHLKAIIDKQQSSRKLYRLDELAFQHSHISGVSPYVESRPQKVIEALRLLADLRVLNQRRQSYKNTPLAPQIDDLLEELPLPAEEVTPALPSPTFPGYQPPGK